MVGWDWQDAGGLVTFMCVLFAVGAVYCVVVVAFVVARPVLIYLCVFVHLAQQILYVVATMIEFFFVCDYRHVVLLL